MGETQDNLFNGCLPCPSSKWVRGAILVGRAFVHFECVAGHRRVWVSRRVEGVSADIVEVGLADALAVALEFDVLAEQLADILATMDGGDDEVGQGAIGGF